MLPPGYPRIKIYDGSPPTTACIYNEIYDNFDRHVRIFMTDVAVPPTLPFSEDSVLPETFTASPSTAGAKESPPEYYYFIYEIYDVENNDFYLRKRGHEVLQIYYQRYGTLYFRNAAADTEKMVYLLDEYAGCKETHFFFSFEKQRVFDELKYISYCTPYNDLLINKKLHKEFFIFRVVRAPSARTAAPH